MTESLVVTPIIMRFVFIDQCNLRCELKAWLSWSCQGDHLALRARKGKVSDHHVFSIWHCLVILGRTMGVSWTIDD